MLRGLVKPPRTLVAFHPLARTEEYTGLPAPEQAEGIVTFPVGVDGALEVGLTLVVKVVDVPVGAAVVVATGTRLLETQALKFGLRAAFKSWVHLPKSWCTGKSEVLLEGVATAPPPRAQAN